MRGKREERYGRYVRPLDRKRDVMAVEVEPGYRQQGLAATVMAR